MGLDIIFEFGEGPTAQAGLSYSSWICQIQPLLSRRELEKCFEGDQFVGVCTDRYICIKIYSMLLVKNFIQSGLRLGDYPVAMYFA